MKTEREARMSPDVMEDKLIHVLEHYLSLHEAEELFSAIFDNQFEVEDIDELLEGYENNDNE